MLERQAPNWLAEHRAWTKLILGIGLSPGRRVRSVAEANSITNCHFLISWPTDSVCDQTLSVSRRTPFLPFPCKVAIRRSRRRPSDSASIEEVFMAKDIKGALSTKDNDAAKRLAKRILADTVSDHVRQILGGPKKRPEPKSMLNQPLPNGKKLGDCTSRDLFILGRAYAIAAERLESGKPPADTPSRKTSKRRATK